MVNENEGIALIALLGLGVVQLQCRPKQPPLALSAARNRLKLVKNRSDVHSRRKLPRVGSKRVAYQVQRYNLLREKAKVEDEIAEIEKAMGFPTNPKLASYCKTDMTSENGRRDPADGAKNAVIPATMENPPTGEFFQDYKVSTW
jgi:hypothetical protein